MIKNLLTGKDNKTEDIGRVLWAIGVISFIVLSAYSVYTQGKFDAMSYGAGFGAVLAGGGIGIGMKSRTEPE